jgi:hypothetical protein
MPGADKLRLNEPQQQLPAYCGAADASLDARSSVQSLAPVGEASRRPAVADEA